MHTIAHAALRLRSRGDQRGFSLIELMVSLVIGLLILGSMVALFTNTSNGNREMARANSLIENGRLSIEVLDSDVVHAGYWGGHVPEFDDQTLDLSVPTDVPTAVPDACQDYTTDPWSATDRRNLVHIPVQVYDSSADVDTLTTCEGFLPDRQANTDVLIVRHVELCVAGSGGNCEADIAGKLYFQATRCYTEGPSAYVLDIDPAAFTLTQRDCATAAEKRKFVSNIYYVRDYAVSPGDGIPTLMRSSFDWDGAVVGQQTAQPLVEGIEGFHVELGIDNRSEAYAGNPTGTPVNYAAAVNWYDPGAKTIPTNRGDGSPDGAFVSCTTLAPCTVAQLINVTAVKIYVLVRSYQPSPGYTDAKTYQLGGTALTPGGGFKRHLYVSTIRLPNIAGRRETP